MDKTMEAVSSILTYCIIASFSQANPLAPQPQVNKCLKQNKALQPNQGISCTYIVTVTASYGSPPNTTDEISFRFGDAVGSEVYVAELDDPWSGRSSQCSNDTIKAIGGPCAFQICCLHLKRTGPDPDGWKPETVTVDGYSSVPVTFPFNTFIPAWFGFDAC